MSESELAARLTAHEHAFEGLLDLIPAKFYNPEDAANQWNKRKQTKEEAVKAKRAKLDPEHGQRHKSKTNSTTQTDVELSASGNGPKSSQAKTKKAKSNSTKPNGVSDQQRTVASSKVHKSASNPAKSQKEKSTQVQAESPESQPSSDLASAPPEENGVNGTDSEPRPQSARNITDLRAKLAAKIEALRTKRKAPGSGVDGAPKSRDAILEARRRKEEARKEKKKLEKEARKDAEMELESEADEPSAQASEDDDDDDDDSDEDAEALSFGRVVFSNGEQLEADGSAVKAARKRKQQDPQSALQAALNKKARLSALPEEKQAKIANSDTWHKALLQADGERVKDDVVLLKKAVKRMESIKKKSTKEWKERLATIAKSKALKQKNREQNLKDRRDSKGKSGGHKKGKQIGAYQGKKKKGGF